MCPADGIGRHAGLRNQCREKRGGSNPSRGTKFMSDQITDWKDARFIPLLVLIIGFGAIIIAVAMNKF